MMVFKNKDIQAMIDGLQPLLGQRNMIGYAAARNHRFLATATVEYLEMKDELIKKYGEEMPDGNGGTTVGIRFDSPKYQDFINDLNPIADVEHDVEIMTLKYSDVIGVLSGEEILNNDWMLTDG